MAREHLPILEHLSLKVAFSQWHFEFSVNLVSHKLSLISMDAPYIQIHLVRNDMVISH